MLQSSNSLVGQDGNTDATLGVPTLSPLAGDKASYQQPVTAYNTSSDDSSKCGMLVVVVVWFAGRVELP